MILNQLCNRLKQFRLWELSSCSALQARKFKCPHITLHFEWDEMAQIQKGASQWFPDTIWILSLQTYPPHHVRWKSYVCDQNKKLHSFTPTSFIFTYLQSFQQTNVLGLRPGRRVHNFEICVEYELEFNTGRMFHLLRIKVQTNNMQISTKRMCGRIKHKIMVMSPNLFVWRNIISVLHIGWKIITRIKFRPFRNVISLQGRK